MYFSCPQNVLATNLSLVSRAVASRPSHPILANILLETDQASGNISLTAFDLNLGIQVKFPANIEQEGSITLPSRLLNDIVSRLPEAEVILQCDKETSTASLLCGSGRYELRGLPADDFPQLPQISGSRASRLEGARRPPSDQGQISYLPVEAILAGVSGSLFAASNDETKRVLTGVHVKVQPQGLEFAATDGHRLAMVEIPYSEEETALPPQAVTSLEVTVPARALRELERMLQHYTEGMIAVQFDETQMVFQGIQQMLTARLLDGVYPDYHRLIPQQFKYQVTVERKTLVSALERVAVLADQKNNIVKVTIDELNQEIALAVDTPEVAAGKESLPAQVAGGNLEVAFNVKYLLDGLKSVNSTDVTLQMNTPTSPAVLKPIGGTKVTYLVMPVQIRG
ncbi:MAG: DNA polymerase III subunit beta [Pseudanabaenaceae cyanobacterium SKYGB_i_bin29]|nr:DNA polymerase III subunit beta [Pseudanabaenaceae cyanobacterium SKYG29]MDW8421371.1 DNA polymerase III subunit beta [Pseudanabaenaceae cyanobacterium SKYGB_i_bin29]